MGRDVKSIISQMTLKEKAGMCSGADLWHLKELERLQIPSVMVSDGPHGLRKQTGKGDHLGINDSIKAVCYPAACAVAASFDKDLLYRMGETLGRECQAEDVSVLLGPGVNIKRSPLCGRNFEYYSEDPYLTGELASNYVKGVQSQNVGTSLKHFAANNQEERRMSISAEVDEQTLREIYFPAFEKVIKDAKPWSVMCSYNRINGEYASENRWLLTEVLRKEWGFDGFVVSDWGAVNDRVKGVEAGLDLEMPGSNGMTDMQIIAAVKDGRLSEDDLNIAVERILNKIFIFIDGRREEVFHYKEDQETAVRIETESAVLLKNEDVLPLSREQNVVFIGEFAEKPRFQGGGSSHINAYKVTSALEAAGNVTYVKGFLADGTAKDEEEQASLMEAAVEAAQKADVAVIFAGLPDSYEAEGYDRTHMRLPKEQDETILAVTKVQKNVIVVLHNGSPIEMPWVTNVKGILEMYLGGQGVGEAAVRLLYGESNPCGRLAETFPLRLQDTPAYLSFPGNGHTVSYREGIFVGYRYYDKKEMNVLFPFGHGLSYTTFAYSDLNVSKISMKDTEEVMVMVNVKNTGTRPGKEVIQLYVSNQTGMVERPVRELKGFEKVFLEPGEEKTVRFVLGRRAFAVYQQELGDWYCASGNYNIEIGRSSREIVLSELVSVESTKELPFVVTMNTVVGELLHHPRTRQAGEQLRDDILKALCGSSKQPKDEKDRKVMEQMVDNSPIRSLRSFCGKTDEELIRLIKTMNQ